MLETVLNWSILSVRQAFAGIYCDFSNTDLREIIKGIECPTLVLLASDIRNFKSAIEEQFRNLEFADLQYVNKGVHFIMYDDEEWYY